MASRQPEEILKVLQEQAREDAAWDDDLVDAELRAMAAMSDDALDDELRAFGVEPADVEAQASERRVAARVARGSGPHVAQAVAQVQHERDDEHPRRRRPVVFWLAAAAAGATIGAGVYAAMHRGHEPQPSPAPSAPTAPVPSSVTPPVPAPTPETPAPVDLVAQAAALRERAGVALKQGKPGECLRLLDEAGKLDPAGDAAPEVNGLRKRAEAATGGKP